MNKRHYGTVCLLVGIVVAGCGSGEAYPSTAEDVAVAFATSTTCEQGQRFLADAKYLEDPDLANCEYLLDNYINQTDCTPAQTDGDRETAVEITLTCIDDGDFVDDNNLVYLAKQSGKWRVFQTNY